MLVRESIHGVHVLEVLLRKTKHRLKGLTNGSIFLEIRVSIAVFNDIFINTVVTAMHGEIEESVNVNVCHLI